MTIAEYAVFAMVLVYLLPIGYAKAIGRRQFDNANPRDPKFYQSGLRARAHGAHVNGIEAFPLFAAAVIVAEFRGAPQGLIDKLAIAFIVLRLIYIATYLFNRASARSVFWAAAFAVNAAIFFAPLYS